jgi:hypothetical protein
MFFFKILTKTILGHHDIDKSGEYVLFFANCDENGAPVVINGEIDSLDPCTKNSFLSQRIFESDERLLNVSLIV